MPAEIIKKNSDKQRLRLVLLLFLLALGIPTLILIKQAYSQLKWEAFHQHRLLAEELAVRIDRRLNELITAEEARTFADYTFLIVAGDPAANFLQRSPLSDYPPAAAIPGMVGYFQIDADEVFSTPLLPSSDAQASAYGIDTQQLRQRKALQGQIRQILSENRLVQRKKTKADVTSEITSAPELTARRDNEAEEQRQRLFDSYDLADSAPAPAAAAPASPPDESYFSSSSPEKQAEPADDAREQAPAQAAFDRLSEADSKGERAAGKKSAEVQVENLELSNAYEQKAKGSLKALAKNAAEIPQRAARKERSALPEPLAAKPSGGSAAGPQTKAAVKINIFESELDPFEISLLDSGHFILFRKVWRNDRRYIQGALLEQQAFISGTIETLFRETALSQSSGLTVAYGGEVLASFDYSDMRRYRDNAELRGALLYRSYLSAPFAGLELIFNLSHLPAGPGGKVVGWLAVIIVLVLCGGTWLMYRLGLRQLALVNQQQDFVSAVSHELKTPLTSIRMYGEMLKQGWVDENKKKTYYEFIFDESERLTRLINNVLQLARMTRNDFEINPKTVKIGELLDIVRSKISTQIERAGFALHMHSEEAVRAVSIEVDIDIFTQIIINLVDNALKFSAKATTRAIDIDARLQDRSTAVFSVRDYGPGIPKNQMTKIFRLFYRSGNELTRETAGTGIGLALVRQLSQAMRGQVDVLNREPGAEFRLVFPVSSEPGQITK
jgi:two-component system, OmpR family, phosphate regulon sensor histidine kinase PhoR